MARLYDCENKETYIEFEFIYHIPGELEGSRFYLRYFKDSVLSREVSVGWTLKQFAYELKYCLNTAPKI